MNVKLILYAAIFPVVLYSLLSININGVFKKNKELEAKLVYIFLTISITYLTTNFLYDFVSISG